tara:strand:+ start:254 stop:664 length:411 start_codon:yes stop_codon:yes gene_type:complete
MVVSKGSIPLQALGNTFPFITSFINNMRKIEREMIQAIIDGRSWSKANTRVKYEGDVQSIYLHDNKIASIEKGQLFINHCGWKTVTTKSRLNALVKHYLGELSCIYQKNFDWFVKQTDNATGKYDTYEFPDGWLLV